MYQIGRMLLIVSWLLMTGCAAKQTITQFDKAPPKVICIAKHEAVREGFLNALQEGFNGHRAETMVINGTYVEKHNVWNPSINPNELDGCDVIAFYVANWAWDITMYMYFANIWVTDTAMTKKIAQATYQTGGGPDKWIDAREKVLEMVDEMYEAVEHQEPVSYQGNIEGDEQESNVSSPVSSAKDIEAELQ